MTVAALFSLLAVTIRAGTSLLYATVGEIFTERSGVLNLGLEGMMLLAAVSGFAQGYICVPWARTRVLQMQWACTLVAFGTSIPSWGACWSDWAVRICLWPTRLAGRRTSREDEVGSQ